MMEKHKMIQYRSHRRAARKQVLIVGVVTILCYMTVNLALEGWNASYEEQNHHEPGKRSNGFVKHHFVSIRSISLQSEETKKNTTNSKPRKTCNHPSIEEFPEDVFTNSQRKHGGIIIHILVSVYMFIALAFVCDDYFVASLDKICERMNLSEDVAGATFMAAGSSAPELFTSIIGLFVARGDVGTGTIVGSAVFNILIILSLVGLLAGQKTELTKWPLCRDSLSYSVAVAVLIGVMYNGTISWYESVIMLVLYVVYCLVMRFNKKLKELIVSDAGEEEIQTCNGVPAPKREYDNEECGSLLLQQGRRYEHSDEESSYCGSSESYQLASRRVRRMTWREVGMMIMLSSQFPPATRFRAACYMVTKRQDEERQCLLKKMSANENGIEGKEIDLRDGQKEYDIQIDVGPVSEEERSFLGTFFWLVSQPIIYTLRYTVPDCKKERWEHWYLATFLMSIVWIGVFSYIMVWMVTVIGYTLGVPDVIMGLTFLAAGTSIPDAIASLIVARQGQGDMAVSNSIGSNVFDILIGLATPWFFKTSIIHPGSEVVVNSRGLKYSVILLFGSVVVTILTIHLNKWSLDRKTGFVFLIVYVLFITLSSLIEFNVFFFVNLPTCRLPE